MSSHSSEDKASTMLRNKVISSIYLFSFAGILNAYVALNKEGCVEKGMVKCRCGKSKPEQYVQISVKICPVKYKHLGTHCEPCPKELSDACNLFNNCDSCIMKEDGPKCIKSPKKKSKNFNETRISPSGYPVTVKMPPGGDGKRKRFARGVDGCDHEFKFETAEVVCKIWPDHVKCEQACIHGYQINGKETRVAKCKASNPHYWYPEPMEECTEVVNCHPMLTTPGDMKCFTHTMSPPHCVISCDSYDRHPETPPRSYHCAENFDPPLPHCAKLNPQFDPQKKQPSKPEELQEYAV